MPVLRKRPRWRETVGWGRVVASTIQFTQMREFRRRSIILSRISSEYAKSISFISAIETLEYSHIRILSRKKGERHEGAQCFLLNPCQHPFIYLCNLFSPQQNLNQFKRKLYCCAWSLTGNNIAVLHNPF